jgi:hypothetical protein
VQHGIDLRIEIRPSPYVTAELFKEHIRTVFVLKIEHHREHPGCEKKPAILLCEKYLCDCSDDIFKELAGHRILAITYPPHTSQIFQVLDSLLVGRFKAAKKYLSRDVDVPAHLDHVRRLHG